EALVAEVEELVLQLLEGIRLVGAVVVLDLRPAGEAGAHEVAQPVEGDLGRELRDEMRLLRARPHEREVAAEDVPQLRYLVEVRPAQDAAEGRDPRIVELGGVARAVPARRHGSELEDLELTAVPPGARLTEQQRTAVAERVADEHDRE